MGSCPLNRKTQRHLTLLSISLIFLRHKYTNWLLALFAANPLSNKPFCTLQKLSYITESWCKLNYGHCTGTVLKVLLRNSGFCNGCLTKRILILKAFLLIGSQYFSDHDKNIIIFILSYETRSSYDTFFELSNSFQWCSRYKSTVMWQHRTKSSTDSVLNSHVITRKQHILYICRLVSTFLVFFDILPVVSCLGKTAKDVLKSRTIEKSNVGWAHCTMYSTVKFTSYCSAKNQYRKFETYIPRKGTAQPQCQFPHSSVCELFIYSHDRSCCSAAGNMWLPGYPCSYPHPQ